MLGHRGCRLGITYPEITEMQARAIFEAAVRPRRRGGAGVPGDHDPARRDQEGARPPGRPSCARPPTAVFAEKGRKVGYLVGTMIEIPRAALTAGEIAETAEFFSFGTNDLTQMTFGLSRDDVPRVLAAYQAQEIYPVDPFVSIDRKGVGGLMKMAVARGGRPSRSSSSASAASTAATRRRSSSATRSASTTSPARPTGCPSPASRPPRRRSRQPDGAKLGPSCRHEPRKGARARLLSAAVGWGVPCVRSQPGGGGASRRTRSSTRRAP